MTSLSDQCCGDYRLLTTGDEVKLSFHTSKLGFTSAPGADADLLARKWRPDWFPNEKQPIAGPSIFTVTL